jgi:flagellar basal body rod protein FlgG
MKPIEVQPGQIHISQDGAITGDTDLKPYAQLAVFNGNFTKTGGGLYSSPNATAQTTSTPSAAKITQGAVENSNVNAISAMTQMITLGRIFDMSQKSISSQDELTQKLTATLAS